MFFSQTKYTVKNIIKFNIQKQMNFNTDAL